MHERKKATKAIILSRVSSKEQEDGYSNDAQKYRSQEYCSRKVLEVVKIFEFTESSTVGNRKKFMEAIDFAKNFTRQYKEPIAIVTDKVDRLQRSYKETPLLNDLIEKDKIELHFHTENCIIQKNSTSQERMMWNLFTMMAQNYVDSLKDNVNRSIAQKLREGKWVSTAPVDYLHTQDKKGTIIIDLDRSPLIKKIFELYATGLHTLPEVLKKITERGLTNSRGNKGHLSRSQIFELIKNPFYYGVMRLKKTGKEYPHIYPPIISKELFNKCQEVRLGRRQAPYKYREKEYIFRGLIKCANTGKVATPDIKKRVHADGSVSVWNYLRIWDANNPKRSIYVPEEKALSTVEKVFASMQLEPKFLDQVITYIKNSADAEKDFYKKRIRELYTEDTKLKNRMDRLMDLFLDGELDKTTHEEKRLELVEKRQKVIVEIEAHHKADDSFVKMLISLVGLASNALQTFSCSNIEEKRGLINLVFANLTLSNEKLEYNLRSPFDFFINLSENSEWYL